LNPSLHLESVPGADVATGSDGRIRFLTADSMLRPISSFLDVSRSFAGRMRDDAVWGLPAKT
jgi:hypothetical protein